MNNKIIVKTDVIGRTEFIESIKSRFPESLQEMDDLEDELLHIDMANFARTTTNAILNENYSLVQDHFNFISELLSKASSELENAIHVSYLENVLLDQTDSNHLDARKLLPENLKKALAELEEHFEKIYESSKNT
ncbi:MAG: hypothetical protein GY928_28120 [Colwellia sp.]|nr:hypothetical protein [Colwellia sp.]